MRVAMKVAMRDEGGHAGSHEGGHAGSHEGGHIRASMRVLHNYLASYISLQDVAS